jgi:hypothetical protein
MDKNTELENAQNNSQPEVQPEATEEVKISAKELEDLKHRAEVSSQNFERLKKAEKELQELKSADLEDNQTLIEDEDETVGKLKSDISTIKATLEKSDVLNTYPVLKEVWSEFDSFRADPENAGMSMKTAAKAFIVEKGLNEQKRKGLEKPSGGQRQPVQSGMSAEEVKSLRQNNFKKYMEMLKKGQIKISQ